MKKIILTGGGTAGHVAPNLALVPALKAAGFDIYYIGSHNGIERGLVEAAGIPYFGIAAGKMRRYKSIKNVTDIFRVGKGLLDALGVIRKIKPDIVFSKGGFVVVPVIAAARLLRVKSVIHESDMTPGLANKLAMPFATKVCVSFKETLGHVPKEKGVLTGTPIRAALLAGGAKAGLAVFDGQTIDQRPVLLVTGGSQGAKAINTCVRAALPLLLGQFNVIHLCGKGNLSDLQQPGYAEFEYLNEKMADVLAAADVVVSRAGANTLFELVTLHKPNLLIPLPAASSRGDQILNAASFEKAGLSMVLPEEELTPERLVEDVMKLYANRKVFADKMKAQDMANGVDNVMDVIQAVAGGAGH
ncbi:MAG: undecaprenyldiphospho-muramoylpentapeptide beta-N-acetylglucosaminyltransferase [Defluviitaleaceae bacterium]|nr:undecaprenyldiphospho-muramoylpentapeptide beta-N-acetylglucosaminyltransferase [Defluviitaleaceae bacterium]